MNIVKTFIKPTEIFGKTLDIKVQVGYEFDSSELMIEDYDTMMQLENGDLEQTNVIVTAYFDKHTGKDKIDQCTLVSTNLERHVMEIVNNYDMIQTAINDLTWQLKKVYTRLGVIT